MGDDEDYEFQYSDDENMNLEQAEDDPSVTIPNMYYTAKATDGSLESTMAAFDDVIAAADAKGGDFLQWSFKSRKRQVKLLLSSPGDHSSQLMTSYRDLLLRISGESVTRNKAEKAINSVLDIVASKSASEGGKLLDFYSSTLQALERMPGMERLTFKTKLKLCRVFLSTRQFDDCDALLGTLIASVQTDGDARSRDTALLELYALQISMYTGRGDGARAGEVYTRTREIKSAVPHPSITGTIHECGGQMWMREKDYERARVEFTDAFKAYSEAGSGDKTIACLQYMLLASMLSRSAINPFESQDTKAYEKDVRVAAMTALTSAYMHSDIKAFTSTLESREGTALRGDAFMRDYIDELDASMRCGVLVDIVRPYTRMHMSKLAAELKVSPSRAEEFVCSLVRQGRLTAKIDQVTQTLSITPSVLAASGAVSSNATSSAGKGATGAPSVAGGAAAVSSGYVDVYAEVAALADVCARMSANMSTSMLRASTHASATQGGGGGGSGGGMGDFM